MKGRARRKPRFFFVLLFLGCIFFAVAFMARTFHIGVLGEGKPAASGEAGSGVSGEGDSGGSGPGEDSPDGAADRGAEAAPGAGADLEAGADPSWESSGDFDALGVPNEILEFVKKYPEARPFAENYPDRGGQPAEIDLSGEVTKGTILLFIQWDERWAYEWYVENFLGVNGCGPTCLSMVVCGLTGETKWNPAEVARFSEEWGYYEAGFGTSWKLMTEGAPQLGLGVETLRVNEENILGNLSGEGKAIICSVRPGDFTYTGHFIVLTGLDEEGNVTIKDPNSPKNSEKHWAVDELLPQIRGMWLFEEKEKPEVTYHIGT